MTYLKINDVDVSVYVNELKVKSVNKYNAETNANGDTVIDYIKNKKIVEVGFIPMENKDIVEILKLVNPNVNKQVTLSFRDPYFNDNRLNTISCIVPDNEIEYYTIQNNRVLYKVFTLIFQEL